MRTILFLLALLLPITASAQQVVGSGKGISASSPRIALGNYGAVGGSVVYGSGLTITSSAVFALGGESRFSFYGFNDPDPGIARSVKVGGYGLAVIGGTKTDTLATALIGLGSLAGPTITAGSGAPANAAPVGSLFTRTDGAAGSAFYVKETGTAASGWTAFSAPLPTNPTAMTTVNSVPGTILTGAAMVGKTIMRTGGTGVFTDTTDSAANIIAAIAGTPVVGTEYNLRIINNDPPAMTLAPGLGVTISNTGYFAAYAWRDYAVVVTSLSPPTVSMNGIGTGAGGG